MFQMRSFASLSNSVSKITSDKIEVMKFIKKTIETNGITYGGSWVSTPGQCFQVGIGRYSANKGLATSGLHLEIEANDLICYDKNKEKGREYTAIHDTEIKNQIISTIATSIRQPGTVNLNDLDKVMEQYHVTRQNTTPTWGV